MLQRYRLRLGDGTILNVDKDGLEAWVADDRRATVQVAGTQQWRPLREFLVEEESAARLARALIPPEPRHPSAPAPPEPAALVPPGPEPAAPALEPAIGAPPVQALAEEPSAPAAPWQAPLELPADDGPPIRLKPLEDQPSDAEDEAEIVEEPQDPYAVARPRAYGSVEDEEDPVRHDRLEGPLLHVLTALGTVLSRLLDPLAPLVSRWTPGTRTRRAARPEGRRVPVTPEPASVQPPRSFERPSAPSPSPQLSLLAEDPGPGASPRTGRDALAAIPLKPLDEDERPARALQGVSERAAEWSGRVSAVFTASSTWLVGLTARLRALREARRRPASVVPSIEPAARKAPPPAPRDPAPPRASAPVQPPTPVAELPSIRFAEGWEPPEGGDVFEGEEETTSAVLPVVWTWTRRIVLLGALAAACVYAALDWAAWFPRAGDLGQRVFTEIDRQTHSGQREREREQAAANATEMCPQLAPETVRLVLATSADRVLEPPEVFQVATEAAERGIGSLPAAEAAELRQLEHALVASLRPPQRARLAEYERARATRGVFPFENPHALDLVARGARTLPAASRARLQHLLGKAVAAGLVATAASPGAASPVP